MDEHKIPLKSLFKNLNASEKGLTTEEVNQRIKKYGYNILQTKRNTPIILKFLKQFTNFFALLLMAGAILSFTAEYLSPQEGYIYIGIALAGVVLLNAIFTFIQQYQSEKIMETFKKMLPEKSEVLRDNSIQTIDAKDIVPGDIILLSEGDKVPADGRLIEQNGMRVDNASLTGESEPQLRKIICTHNNILESRNMVFSGTLVQSGNGKAMVYSTGMTTQIGKIAILTKETKSVQTPLNKELNHFIKIISSIAIILGVLFFGLSFVLGHRIMGSMIFAIGIIVANVPEGLLPTVTLCLSIASKRMAKRNALVKNLESVETLGSTTVICTDKTGTITQNKMEVNTLFINLNEKSVFEKDIHKTIGLQQIVKTMALCNNSKFNSEENKFKGDPTEVALMNFASGFSNINLIFMHKIIC